MSGNIRKSVLGSLFVLGVLAVSAQAVPPPWRHHVARPTIISGPVTVQQPFFIPPKVVQIPPPPWPINPPQTRYVALLPASAYTPAPYFFPTTLTVPTANGNVTIPNLFPPVFPAGYNPNLDNPYRFYMSGLYGAQLNQWLLNLNNPLAYYNNPFAYNPYLSNPYTTPFNPYGTSTYGMPSTGLYGSSYGAAPAANPYANAYPAGNNAAPASAPKANGGGPRSILDTLGVPTENDQVKWPLALRLMPEVERVSLDKLEGLLRVAAAGRASPRTQEEATQTLEKIRHWLQSHQLEMAEGTFRDGQIFLQQLSKSLKTMGG